MNIKEEHMNFSTAHKLFYPLLAALLLCCAACNQDPIFYIISREVKPRPPRVAGTPTAMVLFYRQYEKPEGAERVPVLYIASTTTLHWYAKPDNQDDVNPSDTSWDKQKGDKWWDTAKGKVRQPGGTGNIFGLAATDNYLYALYQKQLRRIKWDSEPDEEWEDVPRATGTQNITFDTIFSSNNRIFIGGRLPEIDKSIPCAILYVDGDGGIQLLNGDTHLLKGVAFNGTSHFLCANNLYADGGSIFKLGSPESVDPVPITNSADPTKSDIPFTGIISLEDAIGDGANHTIVAMDRAGILYTIDDSGNTFTGTGKSIGRSTGALALWRDPQSDEWETWVPADPSTLPRPKLLLAGYQGELILTTNTGYTNGYYELELNWDNPDGIPGDFTEPGKSGVSTIDSNERYLSTIGKYPISGFFQTPKDIDENMTLFASTINEGLWSYRKRDNTPQWNAEE